MRNCTLIQCSIISKGAIATVPGYQGFNIIPGRYLVFIPGTRYRYLVELYSNTATPLCSLILLKFTSFIQCTWEFTKLLKTKFNKNYELDSKISTLSRPLTLSGRTIRHSLWIQIVPFDRSVLHFTPDIPLAGINFLVIGRKRILSLICESTISLKT